MVKIGHGAGRKVRALVTDMDQPLGSAVGNALEVREAIQVLAGSKAFPEVRQVALELGALALLETGLVKTLLEGKSQLAALLDNGVALAKFAPIDRSSRGNAKVIENPALLGSCPTYKAKGISKSGYIKRVNPMAIALAS